MVLVTSLPYSHRILEALFLLLLIYLFTRNNIRASSLFCMVGNVLYHSTFFISCYVIFHLISPQFCFYGVCFWPFLIRINGGLCTIIVLCLSELRTLLPSRLFCPGFKHVVELMVRIIWFICAPKAVFSFQQHIPDQDTLYVGSLLVYFWVLSFQILLVHFPSSCCFHWSW